MRRFAGFVVAVFLVAGCASQSPTTAPNGSPSVAPAGSEGPSAAPSTGPAGTALLPGEPDPTLTPGAIDPAVTQANIAKTICVSGYTTKVRPLASYTDDLKQQQIVAYGYVDHNLADYEEDHLISLEIGGAPRDPKNLWPEPYTVNLSDGRSVGAHVKDLIENKLHTMVCAHQITLAVAQHEEATAWITAWFALDHQAPPPGGASATPEPTPEPSVEPSVEPSAEPSTEPVEPTDTPAPASLKLTIASLTTPIHRGATATLVAHTKAGASCSIDVEYSSGPSTAQGLGDKTANSSGVVSWSWKIGSRTTFGSWPVTISCNVGDTFGSVEKNLVVH